VAESSIFACLVPRQCFIFLSLSLFCCLGYDPGLGIIHFLRHQSSIILCSDSCELRYTCVYNMPVNWDSTVRPEAGYIHVASNIEASASTVRDACTCFEPTGIESSHYPRDYPSYLSRYSPGHPGADSTSSYDTSPVISACLQSNLRYSKKRPLHRHLFLSAMICVSRILDY